MVYQGHKWYVIGVSYQVERNKTLTFVTFKKKKNERKKSPSVPTVYHLRNL